LADALIYSLFLSIAAGIIGVGILWLGTGRGYGLAEISNAGLLGAFHAHPVWTLAALLTYVLSAVLMAEVVGVMRLGSKLRAQLLDWVGKDVDVSDDPIWWTVLDTGLRQSGRKEVFLNVRMTNESTYSGVLLHLPVLADDVAEKDFAIWKARYYAVGQPALELGSDEVVLLNTRNCRAIEVRYADPEPQGT